MVIVIANLIQACYWNRQSCLKKDCSNLPRIVEREDIHIYKKIVFLGQEALGDEIKVPILSEVSVVIK